MRQQIGFQTVNVLAPTQALQGFQSVVHRIAAPDLEVIDMPAHNVLAVQADETLPRLVDIHHHLVLQTAKQHANWTGDEHLRETGFALGQLGLGLSLRQCRLSGLQGHADHVGQSAHQLADLIIEELFGIGVQIAHRPNLPADLQRQGRQRSEPRRQCRIAICAHARIRLDRIAIVGLAFVVGLRRRSAL